MRNIHDKIYTKMIKPELTETEMAKPYCEYYYKPPADIPKIVLENLQQFSHRPEDALPIENINDLLLPNYLPMENGHCRLPNGSFFVAVRTEFKHTTGDMINWWFDWHPKDSLRYRIWYPESHFSIRIERSREPTPNNLPHWYTTHYPVEDIGLGKEELIIHFVPPAEFGFDPSRIIETNVETAICGFVGSVRLNIQQHTRMCHIVRKCPKGLEMRSRYWIGNQIQFSRFIGSTFIERIINTKIIRRLLLPSKTGLVMAMHCAQEYSNLAQILPEIYKVYGSPNKVGKKK